MLNKRQLRQLTARYNFCPKRRLGQNFLIDRNIRDKIIESIPLSKKDKVLEIGPGLGALTELLCQRTKEVYAVEKDKILCWILSDLLGHYRNLKIICKNILEFDLSLLKNRMKIKVIGNLPYYITSPLISYLLERRQLLDYCLLTVQREVASRMVASPGTKDYGAFSCLIQYYSRPTSLFSIKAGAFWPQPKVDSCLMKLKPLKQPSVYVSDEEIFFKGIRGSFNQRRKTVLNALSGSLRISKALLSEVLKEVHIHPNRRPETLQLEEFARIANHLRQKDCFKRPI